MRQVGQGSVAKADLSMLSENCTLITKIEVPMKPG
jgi:hypothetical protein